jgi:putative SOS response-associated peptidase YedK
MPLITTYRSCAGESSKSSGPIRLAILEGMDVRDSRVHNYPPRWNGAPTQDLLVIRRNHQTGAASLDPLRWGLIPYLIQQAASDSAFPLAARGG